MGILLYTILLFNVKLRCCYCFSVVISSSFGVIKKQPQPPSTHTFNTLSITVKLLFMINIMIYFLIFKKRCILNNYLTFKCYKYKLDCHVLLDSQFLSCD